MDQVSIANLITQRQDFCISGSENGLYKNLSSQKKSLKVVYNTTTVGRWQSLTCQNSNGYSPLIFYADLINSYALLPENVSFLDCFFRSHIYFIRTLRKSHETTFVGYFWKVANTSKRYFWHVSEMSRTRHLSWEMLKRS